MPRVYKIFMVICAVFLIVEMLNLNTSVWPYNIQEVRGSDVLTAKRGDKITLQARLVDDLGNPVENETIFFFDETHDFLLGENYTNSKGIATFVWYVPLNFSVGPVTLNVTYFGNSQNYLLSSSTDIVIDIVSELHILPFVTDSTGNKKDRVVAPTDWVFINVSVIDDLNNAMGNVDVIITDENNVLLAHNTTDVLGSTVLKFQVPATWTGVKSIFIRTNCTNSYIINDNSEVSLNITKIERIIDVASYDKIVYYGDVQNISGKVTDKYGLPLVNVQIFLLDPTGNIISTNITNDKGVFFLTAKITSDLFDTGNNQVFLIIEETIKYLPSKVALQFNVKSRSVIISNLKNNSILIAEEAYNISIHIQDQFNSSISKANITLRFEGIDYTVCTDNAGVANIYLFVLPNQLGKNNITLFYNGNLNYSYSSLIVFIMVYEKPKIKINSPTEDIFTIGEVIRISGKVNSIYLSVNKIKLNIYLVNYSGFSKLIGNAKVWKNGTFLFEYNTTNIKLKSQKESFLLKIVIPRNDSMYLEKNDIIRSVILTYLIKTKSKLIDVLKYNDTESMIRVLIRLEMYNGTGVPFEIMTVNVNNISVVMIKTNRTGFVEISIPNADINVTKTIIKVIYAGSNIFLPCESIFYVDTSLYSQENENLNDSEILSMSKVIDWGLILTPILVTAFYFVSKRRDSGVVRLNKMLGG